MYCVQKIHKGFSKISRAITDYLPKEKDLDWPKPTTEALYALTLLKYVLAERSVLALLAAQTIYDRY